MQQINRYIHIVTEFGRNDGDDTFELFIGPFVHYQQALAFSDKHCIDCEIVVTIPEDFKVYEPSVLDHYFEEELGIKGLDIRDYLKDK